MDQADLGDAVGVGRTVIAKMETGARRITAVELLALSDALDVPMGWLVREPELGVLSRRAAVDGDGGHVGADFDMEVLLEEWTQDVLQVRDEGFLPASQMPELRASTESEARSRALQLRMRLGFGLDPLPGLADVAADCGLWIWSTDLDDGGASVTLDGCCGAAVVGGGAPPGRRRFTAAHEVGHHVLADAFEVGPGVAAAQGEREALVDAFAAEFLLPSKVASDALRAADDPRDSLIDVAGRYRVSWSVAVRASQQADRVVDGRLPPTRADLIRVSGRLPEEDLVAGATSAAWQRAVLDLYSAETITRERAVELLRGDWRVQDLPARRQLG